MLSFGDATRPLDADLLDARGGFAWWYLDLVDAHGDGLVLIWSFGLPFLPGLQGSARRGAGERPGAHPSVNVSVYRGGEPAFYLLQRIAPGEVEWDPGTESVRMGRSRFHSWSDDGGRHLRVELDLDVPESGRLAGTIEVDGPSLRLPEGGSGDHRWTPLTTATEGAVALTLAGTSLLDVTGRAYHDRNGSPVPLDGLGADRWLWGRVPRGGGERIWYLLWPDDGGAPAAHVIDVGDDGSVGVSEARVHLEDRRTGWFGLPWYRWLELELAGGERMRVEHVHVVDDGPFYGRFLVRVAGGDGAWGVGEWVLPHRVDLPLHRPFVQMAVQEAARRNSLFLPLFTGERRGRWGRWLRSLLPGPRQPRLEASP